LAQATQKAVTSPLAFARLVRANLMHRRDVRALLQPDPAVPIYSGKSHKITLWKNHAIAE